MLSKSTLRRQTGCPIASHLTPFKANNILDTSKKAFVLALRVHIKNMIYFHCLASAFSISGLEAKWGQLVQVVQSISKAVGVNAHIRYGPLSKGDVSRQPKESDIG